MWLTFKIDIWIFDSLNNLAAEPVPLWSTQMAGVFDPNQTAEWNRV